MNENNLTLLRLGVELTGPVPANHYRKALS